MKLSAAINRVVWLKVLFIAGCGRSGSTLLASLLGPMNDCFYAGELMDFWQRSVSGDEHYVDVFVDTPQEVCEARNLEGLHAKARIGELEGFSGIDDPHERPEHPEVRLQTGGRTPEENAREILAHLQAQRFIH